MFIVSLEVTVTSLHPPRQHTRKGKEDKENPTGAKGAAGKGGRTNRGSTAARPTLTRDRGEPQVRDPVLVVSVNPEADPPHPRAPVRPNWAEQGRGTKFSFFALTTKEKRKYCNKCKQLDGVCILGLLSSRQSWPDVDGNALRSKLPEHIKVLPHGMRAEVCTPVRRVKEVHFDIDLVNKFEELGVVDEVSQEAPLNAPAGGVTGT